MDNIVKKKLLCGAMVFGTLASEVSSLINAKEVIPVATTRLFGLLSQKGLEKKYQVINGPCWVFATLATLETALSKKGILKNSLSEKHVLNWSNRQCKTDGWHIKIEDGNNFEASKGYLISGSGPVYESAMPYNINNTTYSLEDRALTPVYSVKGIKDLKNNEEDSIKEAISEYGAVCARYFTDKDHENLHAISVIGWDDDTKEWLIRDSADDSKVYYKRLPYSFKLIACSVFTDVGLYNSKEKVYQYDQFGTTKTFLRSDGLVVSNVYNFNGNEKLKEVTLGTSSAGCNYSIYYTSSFTEKGPSQDQKDWVKLKSGIIPYNGYFTSSLDKELNLERKKGAIIVKIEKSDSNEDVDPTIKVVGSNDKLKFKDERNKCYIMRSEGFVDIVDDASLKDPINGVGTFSIKARTEKLN